jgi:hypothetical protein
LINCVERQPSGFFTGFFTSFFTSPPGPLPKAAIDQTALFEGGLLWLRPLKLRRLSPNLA